VAADAGLTLADFSLLNPSVDQNCLNLLLGVTYCVRLIGSIEDYPGYHTAAAAPSTVFTRRPTTTASHWTAPTETRFPLASGTDKDCASYKSWCDMSALEQLLGGGGAGFDIVDVNACESVASKWEIGVSELRKWNPGLKEGERCALQKGLSYCAGTKGPTDEW
jgi:hypothetical protein